MNNNRPYNLPLLWETTNNGLDYFHEVFPDSVGKENKSKFFKTHNENTPSTTLSNKKSKDGVFRIYNHAHKEGGNAIDHVMTERNLTFIEACDFLFAKYGLSKSTNPIFQPVKSWENETNKASSYWKLNVSKKHHNYTEFAPFLNDKLCKEYGFVSLSGYEVVRNVSENKTSLLKVEATENYPIYAYQETDFAKTYEPKAIKSDKGFSTKHQYLGNKPTSYIYGWNRLLDKVDLEELKHLFLRLKKAESKRDRAELTREIEELQLPSVIIATGGSDGLNMASMGYDVIWFNSEAEIISRDDYETLAMIAKVIYYCPDLDTTGIKQMVKMGMQYPKIKMIQLPEWLKRENKKDIADWVRKYKNDSLDKVQLRFEYLLQKALEFQFWKWNDKTESYKYVYDSLLFFLEHHGFFVYKVKHLNPTKGTIETFFIKIEDNVVKEVTAPEIKAYVINWLRDNNVSRGVLNMVIPSQFLSEKSLMTLPIKEFDFTDNTASSQLFFFQNKTVRITNQGIALLDKSEVKNMVWEESIIQKNISLTEKQFSVYKDKNGNLEIDILKKDSHFLNYLINTSRIHWQSEFGNIKDTAKREKYLNENRFNIAGATLSEDEIFEQKQHLINKLYSIGYLLHGYKDSSKPWAVYVMDNKIPDISSESHGGSGKSFLISSLLHIIIKRKYVKGRDPEITKNQFIYDGVNEDTKLIFIDDGHYYLNLNFFFSELTGSLDVNPKFGKPFEIPFSTSPKFAITTNFAPKDLDPSTLRRLLFVVFSDYYHEHSEEYSERRQIIDDFGGRKLFESDFTEGEWNDFFNLCFQAVQFYLSTTDKITAPAENVKKRNMMHQMGDAFYDFAKSYFDDEKLNVWIPRKEIQEAYKSHLSGKNLKGAAQQREALDNYCAFNGWKLESKKGRLELEEYNRLGISIGSVVEKFMINTTGTTPEEETEPKAPAKEHFIDFDDNPNDLGI